MYSRRRTVHTRRKLDVTVNEGYCIHGDEYFMSGYATFLFFYYTKQPHGVRSLSKDVIVFIYKLRAAWHFNLPTTHGLQNNVKVWKILVWIIIYWTILEILWLTFLFFFILKKCSFCTLNIFQSILHPCTKRMINVIWKKHLVSA